MTKAQENCEKLAKLVCEGCFAAGVEAIGDDYGHFTPTGPHEPCQGTGRRFPSLVEECRCTTKATLELGLTLAMELLQATDAPPVHVDIASVNDALWQALVNAVEEMEGLPTPSHIRGIMPNLTEGKPSERYLKERWGGR